jgi:hypothetical protein
MPINNIILGGNDPINDPLIDIDAQIQIMENYKKRVQQLRASQNNLPIKLIWDDIDAEIQPLTNEQKQRLFEDEDYFMTYSRIQELVQLEILNLVKGRIESTTEGKDLLTKQLKMVKRLKSKIIDDTNREMEMFKKFKEYSKNHPEVTYDEFIKVNM